MRKESYEIASSRRDPLHAEPHPLWPRFALTGSSAQARPIPDIGQNFSAFGCFQCTQESQEGITTLKIREREAEAPLDLVDRSSSAQSRCSI